MIRKFMCWLGIHSYYISEIKEVGVIETKIRDIPTSSSHTFKDVVFIDTLKCSHCEKVIKKNRFV